MNKPINVLFIEDNPADARLVREELKAARSSANICLEWVDCLQKGLDYLATHAVHAVLVDLSLPDSQGLSIIQRVLCCAPQLPVIVMTGLADEETATQALQAGAQDYLVKGEVDGRLLMRVIRYAVQRKQAEQQLADAREFTERIVTSSPVGIFTYRLTGECLSANAAAAQMVGGTVEELRKQNFHHIQSWKQSGLYDMALQTISTCKPTSGDVNVISTFGKEAWYTAQFVLFRSGGEELLLLIFNDITERKQVEAALCEREEMLKRSQEISHVGSWELDLTQNRLLWSDEVFRIFGLPPREFATTYEAFLNAVHPEDRARVDEAYTGSLREGRNSYDIEHRIIRRDSGEIRFIYEKCEHMRDATGRMIRSVGMVQDITERKKAELDLRASEEKIQNIMQHSRSVFYSHTPNHILTYVSPQSRDLLDCEPEEAMGRWQQFLSDNPFNEGCVQATERAIHTGKRQPPYELELITPKGRRVWVLVDESPVVKDGQTVGIVGSLTDITERKLAEKALRERESLLDQTQSISHVGSWELDLLTNRVTWSDEVHRIFGVGITEFKATYEAFLDTVHPEDRLMVEETYSESLRKKLHVYEMEFRIIRPTTGDIRYVHIKCEHIQNSAQEIVRSVGMVQDITERKKAEAALKASERFTQETLDSLESNIAILDETGTIVAVNRSWREFAQANGADPARVSEGVNYLAVCYAAHGSNAEEALRVAEGLRAVMHGDQESFSIEYPCHSSEIKRWFVVRVTRFKDAKPVRVVVAHEYITERKEVEAALAASEKRFRTWIENSSDIVTVLDAAGYIQYESPSVKRLLGYELEDLLGKNAFTFVHPEDQDKILAAFTKNIQNPNTTVSAEFRFRHQDGSWRYLEGIGRAYVDEHGEVVGLIHSRDITERKQSEKQIHYQANLLANVNDAIIAADENDIVTSWNAAAERMYGWKAEEVLGRNGLEILETLWVEASAEQLRQSIVQSGGWQGETMQTRKDGTRFSVEVSSMALRNEHGQMTGFVSVNRDITERKKAHEQIVLQANLLAAVGSAVIATDLDGRVIYWNSAAEKLYGWSSEEALGRSTLELTVAGSSEEQAQEIMRDLAAGKSWSGEFQVQRKDGSLFPAFVTDSPLLDSEGELIGIIGVSSDISELKEKERLLSDAQRIGRIGSWIYEIASNTMRFSDEIYRLLDVLPEEFHHNREEFLTLVYPTDRPAVVDWMNSMHDGSQGKDLNFRIFHKNGELCYLHCTGAVEFDAMAQPVRFIGTLQDVTDRRIAEIQIDQQVKRLTALSEIDRAIISSFDPHYTLGVLLSNAISQLQVDAADILLLDSDREVLTYAAGQGFRTKIMEAAHVQLGQSHAGRAAKERRMIRVANLRDTTNVLEFSQFVMAEGFVSYVGVPLIVKGKAKGVLEVYQRSPLEPYQEWLDFLQTLAGQAAIAIENTSLFGNLQSTNLELSQAYEATIEGWSRAMDLRDRETEGHTQRVTKLTLELARAMGIDESKIVHIRRGALLHDIGKLGVPDHILFKPGQLTPEEREIIEKHVDFAYEMLAPIPYLKPALNIPYFHHEKWDGTGYPLGLKGEQIPLEARIFALVDVWDALMSDRPYRKAWPREKTVEYIRSQSGTHFDPQVVECFLEWINKAE